MKNALIAVIAHVALAGAAHAQAWTARTFPPTPPTPDSRLAKTDGMFYYAPGGSTAFFRYDPATDAWIALADAPADFTPGSDLCEFKFLELAADFEATLLIERYNTMGNFWSPLPSPGVGFGPGAELAPLDQGIALFQGMGTTGVRRFHELSGTWSNAAPAPVPVAPGSVAVAGPGNTIHLFVPGQPDDFVYDGDSDTWSIGMPLPGAGVGPGASADLGPDGRILYCPGFPEPSLFLLDTLALSWIPVAPGPAGLPAGSTNVIYDVTGHYLLTPAGFESNAVLPPPPPPPADSCGCTKSEAEAAGCSGGTTRGNFAAMAAALLVLLYARFRTAVS